MGPRRRTNGGDACVGSSPTGRDLGRGGVEQAEGAEHGVASGGREDDDAAEGSVAGAAQDVGEVVGERVHDAGAIDDFLVDADPLIGGQGGVHESAGDDVATLLADEEEQGRAVATAAGPAVVLEDEAGEGVAVAAVLAEDLQGRLLRDGLEGARGGGADAVDGHVLEVRPTGLA